MQRLFKTSAEVDVYPENWQAVQVFVAMLTQWRVGMSGAVGLDYGVLPVVESRLGVRRKQRADVFASLRIMERELLGTWNERRAAG